jgi:cation transport ATPase
MTGDREAIAQDVAQKVGIQHFWHGLSPTGKAHQISELRESNGVVAMVGFDDLNFNFE